jgi:hypothetical protein
VGPQWQLYCVLYTTSRLWRSGVTVEAKAGDEGLAIALADARIGARKSQ